MFAAIEKLRVNFLTYSVYGKTWMYSCTHSDMVKSYNTHPHIGHVYHTTATVYVSTKPYTGRTIKSQVCVFSFFHHKQMKLLDLVV